MTVITYQCSVCKRQIGLLQNQEGLEWVGHCNMTLGCRGILYQVNTLQDYIRGVPSPDVVGLTNWVQRQVLFNYNQAIARNTWVINHNLGTAPSVVVFINQPTVENPNAQVEIFPTEITYNTDNQLTLTFPTAYSGIAQCIARSSNPDLLSPRPTPPIETVAPTIQLSNQGILTIATKISSIGNPTNIFVSLAYTLGSSVVPTNVTYTASNVPSNLSPWSDITTILIQGKAYAIRSFNIQTTETISGQVSNGATVQLTSINSTGQFNIPVISVAFAPTNQFVVAGNYSLYFTENSLFEITGATTAANNIPWIASSSIYDPITNQTTITVSNNVSGTFGSSTKIVCFGIRQITSGEVLILLGTTPFTIFDTITNAYVDFTAVNSNANQYDIFFQGGDLFADTSIQTLIYPPIQTIT